MGLSDGVHRSDSPKDESCTLKANRLEAAKLKLSGLGDTELCA